MYTILQNTELLKNLFQLLSDQGELAEQQRVYERLEMLVLAGYHTFGLGAGIGCALPLVVGHAPALVSC